MANQINTRIALKYDSYSAWEAVKDTFKPLKGEVCIVNPATNLSDTTSVPCLMKVGDGEHYWKDLPWVSATAADVYSWAKATEAQHKEWLKTNHADNNTTYAFAIVGGELQVTETPHVNGVAGTPVVKSYDFITPTELTEILKGYYTKDDINNHLKGKKDLQNEVASPETNGSALAFIDTITQDQQGVITATKKTVNLDAYALKTDLHDPTTVAQGAGITVTGTDRNYTVAHADTSDVTNVSKADRTYVSGITFDDFGHVVSVETGVETVVDTDTQTTVASGDGYIKVDGSLTENTANTFTVSVNEDALKALIGEQTTAAMEFKGATSSLPANPAKGDMYKVSASFEVAGETAKVGDSIVYDGAQWYLIPSGDDIEDTWRPVTGVNNDSSLTFSAGAKLDVSVGADGTIEYSHEAITTSKSDGSGRTYVTGVTTDGYGHITGYTTATEQDQDLSGYKTRQE